ncbi:MAG: 2-dehydropantoate 2-reductase [Alphaproteobacteria bacterium]|nr:2-dehydropantoate 2-reductase [Alphaproteobacteria bacterium]
MKVCIYGTGAVGGALAGRLFKGGAEVSAIARGAMLDAIRRHGLTVRTTIEEIKATVRASDDPAVLGRQDTVIVTVKALALPAVAAGIGPLLGPKTFVVFAMNGIPWWYFLRHGGEHEGRRLERIDPGDALRRAIDIERVVGGVVYSGSEVLEPGVIGVETPKGRLILGTPDGRSIPEVEALAAALQAPDLKVEVTPEIRTTIWSKVQQNICSGLLGCLSGTTPKATYADPACADGVRRLVAEVGAVARAMGFPTEVDAEKLLSVQRNQTHVSSIILDLLKGRLMEFDALFGAPVEFARLKGVPTPTLDLLSALVKVRAREAGSYAD